MCDKNVTVMTFMLFPMAQNYSSDERAAPLALPPLDAIAWTSSLGLLAKLPGLVLPEPDSDSVPALRPPPWLAWPPLAAAALTSSLGRLAKFPGLLSAMLVVGVWVCLGRSRFKSLVLKRWS